MDSPPGDCLNSFVHGSSIDPTDFMRRVRPLLERRDAEGLLRLIRERWTCDEVRSLLRTADVDVRKVATLCAGLIGDAACIPVLVERLHDADPTIVHVAEHSLWSIWFRGGSTAANERLVCGVRAVTQKQYAKAIACFDDCVCLCPGFSEAYNQRAIARFLSEDYERSIEDCRDTVRLMPQHFGAWAGMGHCHAQLDRLGEALSCYEHALRIHPRLDGIDAVVTHLRSAMGG